MIESQISLLIFAVLMLSGVWFDLAQRRLPNILCVLVVAGGAVATIRGFGLEALTYAALHAMLALLVGLGLFRLGMIGGGDAKFYAATAIWFPLSDGLRLLLYVSICGFLLLGTSLLIRLKTKHGGKAIPGDKGKGLPYGVAIAFGALALAGRTF